MIVSKVYKDDLVSDLFYYDSMILLNFQGIKSLN